MRDILLALSLANLFFLRSWEKFRFGGFLNDLKPDGPSVAVSVLATALVLYICWRLATRHPKSHAAAKIIFLLSLLVPVNALRLYFDQAFFAAYGPKYQWFFWAILALLVVPIIIAAAMKRLRLRFLVRYGIVLVLALAPFTLFTVGGVLFDSYRAFRSERGQGPSVANQNATRQRVVFIIFDELDNRVAFRERPASLSLPEFDRLRGESMVASAAYPPAGQTGMSVPAYLNGKKVAAQDPLSETRVAIHTDGEPGPEIWRRDMTIFAETSTAGITTGLAGVYFPYCAILDGTVTQCRDFRSFRRQRSFMARMEGAIDSAADAIPFLYRLWLRKSKRREEIYQYQYTAGQAKLLASDQGLKFVYIHFPVPHPPPIYDRRSKQFPDTGEHSYLDNVALADATLGEVRRAMEQTGAWDGSTVIVASDHWWRISLWRSATFWSAEDGQVSLGQESDRTIPFMVKLAGQRQRANYDRAFNTVIARRLIMTLLRDGIKTNAELSQWLDHNATAPIEPLISKDPRDQY